MTTPNEALRTILPIAGWNDPQAADVIFTGGADPVLPTPFRITVLGVAEDREAVARAVATWNAADLKHASGVLGWYVLEDSAPPQPDKAPSTQWVGGALLLPPRRPIDSLATSWQPPDVISAL
jgi:hypothetical protein